MAVLEERMRVVDDKTVHLWDEGDKGWVSVRLSGDTGQINAVTLSLNERHVASGSINRTVLICDELNREWSSVSLGKYESWVFGTAVIGKYVYSPHKSSLRIWDNRHGKWASAEESSDERFVRVVGLSLDEKHDVTDEMIVPYV